MVVYILPRKVEPLVPEKLKKYLYEKSPSNKSNPGPIYVTAQTFFYLKTHLPIQVKGLETRVVISNRAMKSIESRITSRIEAIMSDAPTGAVVEEIKLMLWLNRKIKIEYLGRSIDHQRRAEDGVFNIDVVYGKRKYYWKTWKSSQADSDSSSSVLCPFERYHHLKEWLSDPEARVLMCIGGGGSRMYSATAFLKIIDLLEVRSHLSEIWGSSGGAMIALPYSLGVAPQWIDKTGYDFYNNRYPGLSFKGLHFNSLFVLGKHFLKLLKNFRPGIVEFSHVFYEAMSQAKKQIDQGMEKKPFFAIAKNVLSDHYRALTEPQNIQPYHEKLLCPCDSMQAMVASAAIPLLFKPEMISMPHGKLEYWVDGFLNEEIPLEIPYRKWKLDLQHAPESTPKKLKVFYIDLGARVKEMGLSDRLRGKSILHDKLNQIIHSVDDFLDARNAKSMSLLHSDPAVEVLGFTMKLGLFGALDSRQVPLIIQRSRVFTVQVLDELEAQLRAGKEIK